MQKTLSPSALSQRLLQKWPKARQKTVPGTSLCFIYIIIAIDINLVSFVQESLLQLFTY